MRQYYIRTATSLNYISASIFLPKYLLLVGHDHTATDNICIAPSYFYNNPDDNFLLP